LVGVHYQVQHAPLDLNLVIPSSQLLVLPLLIGVGNVVLKELVVDSVDNLQ
jgi:hypothetical protein